MRLQYSPEMVQTVADHEEKMLGMYRQASRQYIERLNKHGLTMHFHLSWRNEKTKQQYPVRPDKTEGYQCLVNFTLLHQGRKIDIHCPTDAIGYDDYTLETSLLISHMVKASGKLYVNLYDDVDDLCEEIEKYLRDLDDPMLVAVMGEEAGV